MRKQYRTTAASKTFVALFDSALGALAMYGVMRLRYLYEGKLAPNDIDIKAAAIFGLACLVIWVCLRLHRAVWRYTSFDDLIPLAQGVVWASLLTPMVLFIFFERAADFPRSAVFLAAPFFFGLLLVSRAIVMLHYKRDLRSLLRRRHKNAKKAILIGRSHALHDYLRDHASGNSARDYHIAGLIDTAGDYKGRSIRGVPVMGAIDDLPAALRSFQRSNDSAPTLIMVDETADRGQLTRLVRLASENNASLVRFGSNTGNGLTPFEAADLIGRKAKRLSMTPVRQFIEGRRVLITGAGGTIGSELTLQISQLGPARLILIDNAEYNLYNINQKLSQTNPCDWHPYLGDIQDPVRMREIFSLERPEIVLHAAALKHVPLSETNPVEAVKTNVGGTHNIIKLATEFKTDSFTLISTDKAVKPSNIMGATKRLAEMLTLSAATLSPSLSACAVRFGNVLGSTGSVVPLFEEQIRRGGPVTVTHKDATRFFMTMKEAASLVLQASALSAVQRKEMAAVYVLDMGEPVNIDSLARQLIRLRGYVPGRDIDIVYNGLRPGEKLTETLTGVQEDLVSTYVEGVQRFTGRLVDPKSVVRRVERLVAASQRRDIDAMREALAKLLPDYIPTSLRLRADLAAAHMATTGDASEPSDNAARHSAAIIPLKPGG